MNMPQPRGITPFDWHKLQSGVCFQSVPDVDCFFLLCYCFTNLNPHVAIFLVNALLNNESKSVFYFITAGI